MNPDFKALLGRCGAEVENLVLYRILKAAPRNARKVEEADWITFASAQTVRNFVEAMRGRPLRARVACIGPVTARAARSLGLRVAAVPRRYTLDAMVREIARKT
jgi:uroporphyrinogen III methyltransferase/synthase